MLRFLRLPPPRAAGREREEKSEGVISYRGTGASPVLLLQGSLCEPRQTMTDRLPESSLRLGLPSGSLQASTFDLFGRAGYRVSVSDRSVFPRVDDDKIAAVLFRAQEISRYVVDGIVDCGLTGHDWIVENGNEKDVIEICELTYSRASSQPARWVLAVPDESPVQKPEDLAGGVIATELVNVTRKYFADRGVAVTVEFSWGTTETKARLLDA